MHTYINDAKPIHTMHARMHMPIFPLYQAVDYLHSMIGIIYLLIQCDTMVTSRICFIVEVIDSLIAFTKFNDS